MPMYIPAFFLPTSQGIPYLLEDIYLRGGYRTVSTIEARDAIRPAARKVGMMVYVMEDKTLYWIPNSISGLPENVWKPFDATKYINLGFEGPLSVEEDEDGKRVVKIDQKRVVPVASEAEADHMLIATAEGPKWSPKLNLPAQAEGQEGDTIVIGPDGKIVWGRASGLPDTEGSEVGDTVVLNEDGTPVWGKISSLPASDEASAGDALILDADGNPTWGHSSGLPEAEEASAGMVVALNENMEPVWRPLDGLPTRADAPGSAVLGLDEEGKPSWVARESLRSRRVSAEHHIGPVLVGEVADHTLPIDCATATLLRIGVTSPDLLLEIHSTSDYSDTNPYRFRSSVLMYEDDGTTVLEDATVERRRRYSIFSCPDVNNKAMYVRITNEGQVNADVTYFITYLPTEA